MRPVDGILNEKEKELLVSSCLRNGGKVSYKNNGDGTQSPYELNIVYLDALKGENDDEETLKRKFLAAMTILLSLKGVPGIYIHSLLGSRNDYKGVAQSGIPRRINREKLDYKTLSKELDEDGFRHDIFSYLISLLNTRKNTDAFSPYAKERVLSFGDQVFALKREGEEKSVVVVVNVSSEDAEISSEELNGRDLIGGGEIGSKLKLSPYECIWIEK